MHPKLLTLPAFDLLRRESGLDRFFSIRLRHSRACPKTNQRDAKTSQHGECAGRGV